MLTASDHMDRALFLAARGRGRTSPNPMVGAVIVSPDGLIVGQGYHERAGEPHAEINPLEMAGGRARAPGRRTRLSSPAADRHAHRVRAEVDAIGVGSGTILVDDPQLTPRGAYRARPLTRVIFDRRLRTPPSAQVLSTRDAGPVIIVTTAQAAGRTELRRPLEQRGAEIEVAADSS